MKNDALKKLTVETRAALVAALSTNIVGELVKSTKEMTDGDAGTFSVVCSTSDRDRQNEVINQDGWDLSFYKLNPVVLWAHDYNAMPIGVTTSISVEGGKLIASGKFAPTPFAQQIRQLYDLGFVRTVSVGLIPKEYDTNDRDVITKAELLEFSFCPVPANPFALTQNQVKDLRLDVSLLMTKGLKFEVSVKAPIAGDSCQLDDGTPGVLAANPHDPSGPMVCIPSKSMAVKASMDAMHAAMESFKAAHAKAHLDHHANHTALVEALHGAVKDAMKDAAAGDKAFSEKSHAAIKDSFEAHHTKVHLENQRHSKEMEGHLETVHKTIKSFVECVNDAMKDYPNGEGSGEDVGRNPTADSVRMHHLIKSTHGTLTELCTALKDYAESEGGKKAEEGEPAAPAPKVEPESANPGLDKFLKDKELVKTLNIALGKVLRAYNRAESGSK